MKAHQLALLRGAVARRAAWRRGFRPCHSSRTGSQARATSEVLPQIIAEAAEAAWSDSIAARMAGEYQRLLPSLNLQF